MSPSTGFASLTRTQREILASLISVVTAASLALYAFDRTLTLSVTISDKLSIAIAVAMFVRWINLFIDRTAPKEDIYATSRDAVIDAVTSARERLWFAQNWLQDPEGHATAIIAARVPRDKLRVIFASFCADTGAKGWYSPVYARGKGRGLTLDDMKSYVKKSTVKFVAAKKLNCVKFNFGHFPAWLAIADSQVFWGITPIHESNWQEDFNFHVDSVAGEWGSFWVKQFELIWDHQSHFIEAERSWNEKLRVENEFPSA